MDINAHPEVLVVSEMPGLGCCGVYVHARACPKPAFTWLLQAKSLEGKHICTRHMHSEFVFAEKQAL